MFFTARSMLFAFALTCLISISLCAARAADVPPGGPTTVLPSPAATSTPPQPGPSVPEATPVPERLSFHAQVTNVQLYHASFPAAYTGANSLSAFAETAKTFDLTAFIGARLWKGAAAYVNQEFDQGFGFNNTLGGGGYVSAEAYKIGATRPYGRTHRYFITQRFNFGGGKTTVTPDQNQLGDSIDTDHLALTFGKYSPVDIFDSNVYAHDPKNDFLNWSIVDAGAFDYAADAWGYTRGLTAELAGPRSVARLGVFQLSAFPNTTQVSAQFLRQVMPVLEFEQRTSFLGGRPGAIKALVYDDIAYQGAYADAVATTAPGTPPSTGVLRDKRRHKIGEALNIAQEVAPHMGMFARLSAMNGSYEAFDFTEIDRSLSGGVSIDGGLYHRPNDTIGLAFASNALAGPAQRYFQRGGLGILIGDGALSYAGEQIFETYYRLGLTKGVAITGDYQRINNPAYNTARGPVSVFGVRLHAQI